MKKYIIYLPSGMTVPVEADRFEIDNDQIKFYKDDKPVEDIYVSSRGSIVIPEELVKKKPAGFNH